MTRLLFLIKSIISWAISRSKEQLLAIKYKKAVIGHLIYDNFLVDMGFGTVKWWDMRFIKYIYFSFKTFYKYEQIFQQRSYELFYSSGYVYIGGGTSCAAAILNGVKVVQRKYGPNLIGYKIYKTISDLDLFVNHPSVSQYYNQLKNDPETAVRWSENYIRSLFKGDVLAYDWNSRNAYEKSERIKEEYYNEIFDKKFKHTVFIFSHIFVDAVHCYRESLYPDYEIWLRETLKIATRRKDALWIIKPHPSEDDYKLKIRAEDIYKDFVGYENIKLFPPHVSTTNLINDIDAIITVRGTATGEYSCVGIPVVTTGRSAFDEGGFCISPRNKKEYEEILLHSNFERLSEEKIRNAKIFLYTYTYTDRIDMPLLHDLKSTEAIAPLPEEVYSHLLSKISNLTYHNVFSPSYKIFLSRKLIEE